MQVRDGPAAVRGDALPPRRHWVSRPGKAAGEGAPSQKTCCPPHNPEPLAEGGFVHRFTIAVVAVLAAALVVVSLSAAAHPRTHARHYPHRIVSLSPTVTEDLFAIGAGKQVVAVDNRSNYPKRAPHTSLSGYSPNVEAIANYHPDLVLISYDPGNFASQLRQLGIKVVFESAATNLKQAYREIAGLGRLTGHARGAAAVVHSMRTHLAAIVASVPKSRRTFASPTSSTRPTTRPRRRRSSAASTSSLASGTSPTRRAGQVAATPALGRVHHRQEPADHRPRRHEMLSRATRRSPIGRAGTRSLPCSTTASCSPTTTSPRAGGRDRAVRAHGGTDLEAD